MSISASALEEKNAVNETHNSDTMDGDNTLDDDDISLLASTPSSVNISFSPTAGSASLSPTTSAGQSAQINVLAKVSVQNSGGYSVYVKSNSQNLVGKGSNVVIPGIQGRTSYGSLAVNTWGYYAAEGESVANDALYKAVSTSGNGDKISENTSERIVSDAKNIMLSFAAKINNEKPADTYTNTVTLSVVSSPMALLFLHNFGVTTMQAMTSTICANAPTWGTARLTDTRDNKKYWVQKMPDGKCWMTQNLALDLGTSWPDASKSDYSTAATAYTPVATASAVTESTINASSTSTHSWDTGNYVSNNPTVLSACGAPKNSLADCKDQFTAIGSRLPSEDPNFYDKNSNKTFNDNTYDAHFLVGNYYSWNAATAGTGGTIINTEASGSICPKNWKLPTGNSSAAGSYHGLISAAGVSSAADLRVSPYFIVSGGVVGRVSSSLLENPGAFARYWTAGAGSSTGAAYIFQVTDATTVPDFTNGRANGMTIRCVAR